MAREKDVGHTPSVIFHRPSIYGRCQKVILERVGEGRCFVADGSGDEAYNGISHYGSGEFAPGEYIVANRDFARDEVFANSVVYALVVSAKDDEVFLQRKLVGHLLTKGFTIRRGVNDFIVCALALQVLENAVDGLDLQYHSGCESEWIVVHSTVFVGAVVAQVVYMNFSESLVLGTFDNAMVERTL